MDECTVLAADRVRFDVSLVYQPGDDQPQRRDEFSVIDRFFADDWREHCY